MKPQAIKTAYITELVNSGMSQQEAEEKWNEISQFVDENGWINWKSFNHLFDNQKFNFSWSKANSDRHMMRPKSLDGIENNRGWTAIHSEKDLPSSQIPCWFELKDDEQIGYYVPHKMSFAGCDEDYHYSDVKAYSEIKQPPKRIY